MNEKLESNTNQPQPINSREERRMRRGSHVGGSWIIGAILVALGIIFLFQNMGTFTLNNWWALFILIPALGAFEEAWRGYKNAGGRLTKRARGSMLVGLVLTLVVFGLLFELDWKYLGPVLIILAGIGILVNVALPGDEG